MAREFLDDDLRRWEAFATAGAHGFPQAARITFRSRSDSSVRPRWVTIDGDKSDAEARLARASEEELRALFQESLEID